MQFTVTLSKQQTTHDEEISVLSVKMCLVSKCEFTFCY